MATYGKLRQTTISGQAGTTWYVQLWKKDYTGSSSEMTLNGEGFSVKWSGQGGTRDRQFINSECVLNMYAENSTDEALIYDIFSKGDRNYYVRVYKNGQASANIWWFGWVNPSFSKIENTSFPYGVNIKATDSIGTFSKQSESSLSESDFPLSFPINNIIKDFGDDSGIYNSETELVIDGTFPDPNTAWYTQPTWTIPTGGGQIDYDGTSTKYIRQVLSSSIVAGNDYTISFTISNLDEGDSAELRLYNYNAQYFFDSSVLTYTSNGNYQVSGALLWSSNGLMIKGYVGDSFSLTDVSVIDGLISNPSPCPTNNNWFQTSIDWWANESTFESNDPFNLYRISKLPFRKDPEKFPNKYLKYDVLKESLKTFGTNCVLSNGKYSFIQPNSYKGSTTGELPFYRYKEGNEGLVSSVDETNLLELNGTTDSDKGVVMSGSVLTFEPPFKSVSAKFKNGNANILIHPNANYSSYGYVGNLQQDPSAADDAYIFWQLNLYFLEVLVQSAVDVIVPSNQTLRKEYFNTKFTWNIKIDNGTTTYYLTHNPDSDKYHWVLVEPDNINYAGYSSPTNSNPQQSVPFNSNSSATIPCNMYMGTGLDYQKRLVHTSMMLGITSELPPITGSVSVELNAENIYYSWQDTGAVGGQAFWRGGLDSTVYSQERYFYPPSPVTDSNSISINDEGEGVIYYSEQTDVISEENFDFQELTIGSSGGTGAEASNVQYLDSSSISISVSEGFRRGGSGGFANITQLLCSEFLSLQSEPLEVFQADIFSPDISPLKLMKYSINDDGSYNYYTFLGGKFSAQSETMSGEWYKINYTTPTIIDTPETIDFKRGNNQANQTELLLLNSQSNYKEGLIESSLGVLATAITASTATTSITLGSALKGELSQNQTLKLTMPNGANAKTITVSDGYNTSATTFNTDSFTTNIDYPIGSIISAAPYEMVSLMQRLTTSGTTSSRSVGVNVIQEINFLPHDFNLISSHNVTPITDDLGGSIKAHPIGNMYAQKLVSKGKTITKVNIFGSANFGFRVYEGFIFNDTTTLVGTGTANTELDITDIVGTSRNYINIEIAINSTSDEVYGGYALVTNT